MSDQRKTICCASHNFLETHNSSLVRIGFNNRPQSIALSVSTSKASIQQQKSKPKTKKSNINRWDINKMLLRIRNKELTAINLHIYKDSTWNVYPEKSLNIFKYIKNI